MANLIIEDVGIDFNRDDRRLSHACSKRLPSTKIVSGLTGSLCEAFFKIPTTPSIGPGTVKVICLHLESLPLHPINAALRASVIKRRQIAIEMKLQLAVG
jgi:hypothetical protein